MVEKNLKTILSESSADATEVFWQQNKNKLTRFAGSEIHQNLAQESKTVTIVVHKDKKKGSVSTTDTSIPALREALKRALDNAVFSEPDPDFIQPPAPQKEEAPALKTASQMTAEARPEQRAEVVRRIAQEANKDELKAYGAFSTDKNEYVILNSQGMERSWHTTKADLKVLLMGGGGEGFARDICIDFRDIDDAWVLNRAREKCIGSQKTETLSPGEYTVILEPQAVADMINYLNMVGFNGLACHEGRSYFSGREGEKLLTQPLTIIDDPWDEEGFPQPFDFEGILKKPLAIIDKGIFKTGLYDTYLAHKAGKERTGHALPPAARPYGSMALNLRMEPGDKPYEELLASVDQGVLVTRFHYVGMIHPTRTLITGLTRDGTFFIEGGQVKKALKNLRFTQSIIEALNNIRGVGKELERVPSFFGSIRVPALCIENFTFTGVSQLD